MAAAIQERLRTFDMPAWSVQETIPRLLTLRDIVEQFDLVQFGALIRVLSEAQYNCHVLRTDPNGAKLLDLEWIKRIVRDYRIYCAKVGFSACEQQGSEIAMGGISRDLPVLATHLYSLQESLFREARLHTFINIRPDLAAHLQTADTFAKTISAAFPSAVPEVREAGNCLAVSSNTAAVFHLMRAAEYGLRALARDRRVKVPKGPLALATWEDIIKELEKAEMAIQGYPKTLAREKQFEFYHGAMMEFKRFKNKFRNNVMHTRESYDSHQAKSAFDHVADFMTILASKISETKRTPMIWKRG